MISQTFVKCAFDLCPTFIQVSFSKSSIPSNTHGEGSIRFDYSSVLSNGRSIPFDIRDHFIRRSSSFHSTFVTVLSDVHPRSIWHPSSSICLVSSIHRRPFIDIHSPFIPIDTPYSSNCTLCYNFVASALYCYKILGHGTTPCPWMMRALLLSQSPSMSYEVTPHPLNQFLSTHDLHDGTIKLLQHHHHLVQLPLGIQV